MNKPSILILILASLFALTAARGAVWLYSNSRQSQVLESTLFLAPIPDTIYFGDSYTLTVTTNPIRSNQEINFLMNGTSVANATTNTSGMVSVIYQPPETGYYNFTARALVP